MSDAALLFAILAALYLWECACWIRRGSLAFVNWFGKRWHIARPGEFIGNQQGGFIFANPLPPLGTIITSGQLPVSFSSKGILTWVATSAGLNTRPLQKTEFYPFTEMQTVSARNRKLFVNDKPVLKLSSATFATHLAKQIESVKSRSEKERPAAIEAIFRDAFDQKEIARRWDELQTAAGSIRWLTNGLVLYLFAFAPVMIWQFGLRATWLSLVVGLLTLTISLAFFFHRTHKKFFPAAEDDRFTHVIMIALAPATATRAHDILSRPLLETFHPLTVAQQFCDEAEFREFAGKILRDLRHPIQPVCPSEKVEWKEIESFSRQTLLRVMEKFLKQNKVDSEKLCSPPEPTDETCRSYCPRCLAQFTTPTGECADCGGLQLMPLTAIPADRTVAARS